MILMMYCSRMKPLQLQLQAVVTSIELKGSVGSARPTLAARVREWRMCATGAVEGGLVQGGAPCI